MKDLEYYKEHLDELAIRTSCGEERETVIVIPHNGTTRLSTSDSSMFAKIKKILKDPETDWRLVDVSHSANEPDPNLISEIAIETDKKLVRISSAKRTRELTDEQRAAISERFRKTSKED